MSLHGGALARLNAMLPPGHVAQIALSLTDEYPYAFASVIISAVPAAT
jgi:holo-[acyl-carrier protein] synthase